MTKKNINIKQLLNTLKTELPYSQLVSSVVKYQSTDEYVKNINFNDSKFSKNGKFYFPYSIESAVLIIQNCNFFSNAQDLIETFYFKDSLNLHTSFISLLETNEDYSESDFDMQAREYFRNSEFTLSGLSKEMYFSKLTISTWSYTNFVVSATFFYLEYNYTKFLESSISSIPKTSKLVLTHSSFFDLQITAGKISLLLLNKMVGKQLFFTLRKINIFTIYPEIWLRAFSMHIDNTSNSVILKYYKDQKNKYYFNRIKQNKFLEFSHVFFYLKALDFLIPKKIRKEIFLFSLETKNIDILYYIFQKYLNIFYPKLKFGEEDYGYDILDLRKYNDYKLNKLISRKLEEIEMEFK